ncbi:hypothetical protein [Hymenobacter cellulosilyticus]|uniref:Uncharacterized protein n=1 Tax=Hymenobacter cellulosilyticus TaxID=2932248 RepID=A0A8T9Q6C7_9BACT|nr:hypothetical protein [Hymenobacter cellulosilyticus]UOQ71330.1 hypothetical protein MUN79_22275 [Hymenobacter cellulosilyticus]
MEHTDDPVRIQALLNEHTGWSAMLWMFSPSLRRLVLRVYHFQEVRELYVVCVGCKTIVGAFEWQGAQLRFTQKENEQEARYWLRDEAGFELSFDGGAVVSVGIPSDEWLSNF